MAQRKRQARRGNALRRALTVFGLLVLSGGILEAQPAPQDAADDGADVTVPLEKEANLTLPEMNAGARELVTRMQQGLERIVELRKTARKQKDVIKLNCVNDKLLQIKQLLNIAEGAVTNLVEATAQEDVEGGLHEYGKVVIADQQAGVLVSEAENCIGEELVFLGPTEVVADEPANPDDPTADTSDFPIEPPGYASPFL